jgi:hypothetical protein
MIGGIGRWFGGLFSVSGGTLQASSSDIWRSELDESLEILDRGCQQAFLGGAGQPSELEAAQA